jgi:hypothetical protein
MQFPELQPSVADKACGNVPPTQLKDGRDTPIPGAIKVTAVQAVHAAQEWKLCPSIPDEFWFSSRLPSMQQSCWITRRKRSREGPGQ